MSTVTITYHGTRYVLAPGLGIRDVHARILERMNHAAHYVDRLDRRPFGGSQTALRDGVGGEPLMQFDPFEVFELADGGEVWIACRDGMDLALEVTGLPAEHPGHR